MGYGAAAVQGARCMTQGANRIGRIDSGKVRVDMDGRQGYRDREKKDGGRHEA
jgi:hypothetical protein